MTLLPTGRALGSLRDASTDKLVRRELLALLPRPSVGDRSSWKTSSSADCDGYDDAMAAEDETRRMGIDDDDDDELPPPGRPSGFQSAGELKPAERDV